MENYRWLAGLIAAHPNRKIVGRTRLQKEVKLLQSVGFPTDYDYRIHFYGPYSEGIVSDIGFLEAAELLVETSDVSNEGNQYYVLHANPAAELEGIEDYHDYIQKLSEADPIVLELAATYDAFRDAGADHEDAVTRLRRKKGSKCDGGKLEAALVLLDQLGLRNG